MHQIEIVRLCAIWDKADPDKESIPTVVELIDTEEIIDVLANEVRSHWTDIGGHLLNPSDDPELAAIERETVNASNSRFGDEQALKAKTELMQAINDSLTILRSPRLASVVNLRDKHLAHSLTTTRREKRTPVQPMKFGDETELLNASIPIVERLYCWVNGVSFSVMDAQEIDQRTLTRFGTGANSTYCGKWTARARRGNIGRRRRTHARLRCAPARRREFVGLFRAGVETLTAKRPQI